MQTPYLNNFGFCPMPERGTVVMDMSAEQLTFKGTPQAWTMDLNSDHEGPQLKDLLMGHESPKEKAVQFSSVQSLSRVRLFATP